MDSVAIIESVALSNALLAAFHSCGMKPLPDADLKILEKLKALGVIATVGEYGLELSQAGTLMVLSKALETIRTQNPELFVSDPRRDAISCRTDFHGSASEIASAKSQWIGTHSLESWEKLPATRAEAERRAVVPSATMTRKEYLCLSSRERSQLAGLVGPFGIGKIMARTK